MIGGRVPDSYTLSSILKACSLSAADGRDVHALVVRLGFGNDLFVSNALVSMYVNSGRLDCGLTVFDEMSTRDLVTWNSVIGGFARNDCYHSDSAAAIVGEMMMEAGSGENGFRPDSITIVNLLSCCGGSDDRFVVEVHGYALRNGIFDAPEATNAVLAAYGRLGLVEKARSIFDGSDQMDRVTWNILISCFAKVGLFEESFRFLELMKNHRRWPSPDLVTYSGIISSLIDNNRPIDALELFRQVTSSGTIKLDSVLLSTILPAVGLQSDGLNHCREIHCHAYRHSKLTSPSSLKIQNALISAYSRSGHMAESDVIFAGIKIQSRDVITWSSMIAGYVQNGMYTSALNTFREMTSFYNPNPNPTTVTTALSACASAGSLKQGREIHGWTVRNDLDSGTFVGSALIDMYAKTGSLGHSRRLFDSVVKEKNAVTWNAMIGGYAVHGSVTDALEIFAKMDDSTKNGITYLLILTACSHGGMVERGMEIFRGMKEEERQQKHYACVVDMLGRSGRVEEGRRVMESVPAEIGGVTSGMIGGLVGGCRIHGRLEVGMEVVDGLVADPWFPAEVCVLKSNLLASVGKWKEVEGLRSGMRERGVRKVVGCSWIEVGSFVHCFVADGSGFLVLLLGGVLTSLDGHVRSQC